ncbi:unnamed protein product [Choristocarpus tenellus]
MKREGRADRPNHCYRFDVPKGRKKSEQLIIDATRCRGVGAFFNHTCCNANLEVKCLVANLADTRFPILAFYAKQKVAFNEELVFNYGSRNQSATPADCRCDECLEVLARRMGTANQLLC